MEIKILSPLWGHEHLPIASFLDKVTDAGYDGIETWIPKETPDQKTLLNHIQRHQMHLIVHQHEANGNTFEAFKESFAANLLRCAALEPLLINSHTARDYFSVQQQLELVDIAQEFSERTGILVTHETHRGRLGYSPQNMEALFDENKELQLTADFSHWTCVTESMLENFPLVLKEAIKRSRHIHARVGFEQGAQVSDPRAPEWQYAMDKFLGWWDEIVSINRLLETKILPITTEFGPAPYMPTVPFTGTPVADQFELNCYMKDLLRERYQ
ncbi:sugar phosphate isomerase/epimerase family protein [Pedobacter sp. PWIIR3]